VGPTEDSLFLSRPWSAGANMCPIHGYFAEATNKAGAPRCTRRGCEACAAKLSLQNSKPKKVTRTSPIKRVASSESRQSLEGRVKELEGHIERNECDRIRLISAMEAEERCMIDVFKELEDGKKKMQEVSAWILTAEIAYAYMYPEIAVYAYAVCACMCVGTM
jgi:hypothetical protein